MYVVYNKSILFQPEQCSTYLDIQEKVSKYLSLSEEDIYLEQNGKILNSESTINCANDVKVVLRLRGGKGGFGSMLRAIGAQIEKTTNREACRDLSGRRLRDINEEQRLKNWLASKAEREKETAARKKKKLERMCEKPKHEFKDDAYFKELAELPGRVEDAVLQGLEASASCSSKRPAENDQTKNKKRKLWLDDELDEMSSSDEDGSDTEKSDETVSKSEENIEKNMADISTEKDDSDREKSDEVVLKSEESISGKNRADNNSTDKDDSDGEKSDEVVSKYEESIIEKNMADNSTDKNESDGEKSDEVVSKSDKTFVKKDIADNKLPDIVAV